MFRLRVLIVSLLSVVLVAAPIVMGMPAGAMGLSAMAAAPAEMPVGEMPDSCDGCDRDRDVQACAVDCCASCSIVALPVSADPPADCVGSGVYASTVVRLPPGLDASPHPAPPKPAAAD